MKIYNHYKIAAVLLCLGIYHAIGLNGETVQLEDSAVYVVLAEALANGQGYTNIGHVGEPINVQYPPLFPLLLTLLVHVFGRNFLLMKTLVFLFAFASLLLIYIFVRDRAGEKKALLIVAIAGISPTFFLFSHEVMSDIPYLCISLLALNFLSRYIKEAKWVTGSGAATLICIAFAYLTRSIGFSLLLAAPFSLFLLKPGGRFPRRLIAAGIFALLCALPAFGWMVRNASAGQKATSDYTEWFWAKDGFAPDEGMVESLADFLPRLQNGLYAYGQGTVALLFPSLLPAGHNAIVAVVALPLLLGFLCNLWRRKEGGEMYVAFYGLVLLLFPNPQAPRYLLPLLPFLLLYFLSGVEALACLLHKRLAGTAVAAFAAMLLGANIVAAALLPSTAPIGLTDYREAGFWLTDHTAPDSVIMSRKPHLLYLWGNRKGMRFPFTAHSQGILQAICDKEVDYIVQDSFSPATAKYLVPMITKNEEIFTRVYSRNGTHLFEVNAVARCERMS